ncbi:hypothetical protein [Lysobacter sp. GCM10012299]|uniref:hypothetical protein n=1 Tax=Lysobacter sp. GCM10012299 TaxID=3317333 RepID=UPI0036215551
MKKICVLLVLAATSLGAQAAELTYTYVEADYTYSNNATFNDSQGLGLKGSLGIGDHFFAHASYGRDKLNNWGGHNSVDNWSVGGGFFSAIGSNADWVTQAAYIRKGVNLHLAQFDSGDVDVPDVYRDNFSGFRASTGVRGMVSDKLEGHAYLGYEDMGNIKVTRHSIPLKGDVYGDLGLQYKFSNRWGATGGVMVRDVDARYQVGVRASF